MTWIINRLIPSGDGAAANLGLLKNDDFAGGDGVGEVPVPVGAAVPQRDGRSSPLSWRMAKAEIVFHHRAAVSKEWLDFRNVEIFGGDIYLYLQ